MNPTKWKYQPLVPMQEVQTVSRIWNEGTPEESVESCAVTRPDVQAWILDGNEPDPVDDND